MSPRTVDTVQKEIDNINEEIKNRRKVILQKKRENRSLLREERDQLRYVVGGLILDHIKEIEKDFPGLLIHLYSRADTRDKIKFVRSGFIDENPKQLKEKNKQECQASVLAIEPNKDEENLSDDDKQKLERIKEYLTKYGAKAQTKLYGKSSEIKVFLGNNIEMYISDKLAAFLRDNCSYSW